MIRRVSSRPRLVSDAEQDFQNATVEVADGGPYDDDDDLLMDGYGHMPLEDGPSSSFYDGGSLGGRRHPPKQDATATASPSIPRSPIKGRGSWMSMSANADSLDDVERRSTLVEDDDDLSAYMSCHDSLMARSSSLLDLQVSFQTKTSLLSFSDVQEQPGSLMSPGNMLAQDPKPASTANLAGLSAKRKRPSQNYLTPKSSYASLTNALHMMPKHLTPKSSYASLSNALHPKAAYVANNAPLGSGGHGFSWQPMCTSSGRLAMKRLQVPLDLPEENLISIASYLPLQDVRKLAATCKPLRETLVASQGATHFIWIDTIRQSFPGVFQRLDPENSEHDSSQSNDAEVLDVSYRSMKNGEQFQLDRTDVCASEIEFVDDYQLSIPGLREGSDGDGRVNLPLLSGLLPSRYPRGVDPATLYGRVDMLRYRLQFRTYALAIGSDNESQNVVPVVQFMGSVGTGDRCIRSDRPFPSNCDKVPCSCGHGSVFGGGSLPSWMSRHSCSGSREGRKSRGGRSRATPSRAISFRSSSSLSSASGAQYHPFLPTSTPFVTNLPAMPVPGQRSPLFRFLSSLSHHCNTPGSSPRSSCHEGVSDAEVEEKEAYSGLVSKCKQCLGRLRQNLRPCDGMRPFVVPTVISDAGNGGSLVVDLTPRLVAYFEVTIIKRGRDEAQVDADRDGMDVQRLRAAQHRPQFVQPPIHHPLPWHHEQNAHRVRQRHECVAVGLSTMHFDTRDRMPGWDTESYGYHGDDGGIFHGNGDMLRRYGPSFGPGDTVGCGLEYSSRRIFFTKNGDFLGYAFEKVGSDIVERGLYPTVGVDTECPIFMNFGERPFGFNISEFVARAAEEEE